MVAHEAPAQSPEKQKANLDIPKSREIFTGDINDAVITVQKITGFEITPDWWFMNVGNEGTTESILERFDTAFEIFVHEATGISTPEEDQAITEDAIIEEAEHQLRIFDERFANDPGAAPLKAEFIDALESNLKEKYFQFSEGLTIPTETDGYSGEVWLTDESATVEINKGVYPELERFVVINDAPVNTLFGADITVPEEGVVRQVLPTAEKINTVRAEVFGSQANHLEVTQVNDEGTTEIDAKMYWRHLANGEIPIAGTKDTNYFIHDRAVDDHVLGWVVSPGELDDFIQKAGQAISEQTITVEKAKEAVAAYDFLTSTLTLYAWRIVNGDDVRLPLRGNANDTVAAQTDEAEARLSYAPDAIKQMVQKIEDASGTRLTMTTDKLLKEIESRAHILKVAI